MASREKPGFHYPGLDYLGPGTPIVSNIINKVRPKSINDAVALQHDIDYLSGENRYWSDLKAIYRSKPGLDGTALRLGLSVRMLLDLITSGTPLNRFVRFDGGPLGPTENAELAAELTDLAKEWELW